MSETSEALPQVHSGIGTILRLLAIALGIMSATLLVHSAFGIRFNEDFVRFLDIVRDIVGFVAIPFELILVVPAVSWLHERGLVFDLHPHWKNAFVLLWLFNASFLRAYVPISDLTYLGQNVRRGANVLITWAWASLAALFGGVMAGSIPIEHQAVFWWPTTAFFLFQAGNAFTFSVLFQSFPGVVRGLVSLAIAAFFASVALGLQKLSSSAPIFWWPLVAFSLSQAAYDYAYGAATRSRATVWFAVAGAFALFATDVVPIAASIFSSDLKSAGLANLAAFVAILAAVFLFMSLMFDRLIGPTVRQTRANTFVQRWLDHPRSRTGLDILAVLGGAAFIVWLGHALA